MRPDKVTDKGRGHMRRITIVAATTALIASGAALSGPARAADSSVDCGFGPGATWPVTVAVGESWTIANSSSTDPCSTITFGSSGVVTWTSSAGGGANPSSLDPSATFTVTGVSPGTMTLTLAGVSAYDDFVFTIIPRRTTATNTQVPPPPRVVDITLDAGVDARCTVSKMSANQTSWLTLPKASDCTPTANKPRATLLGWSTTAGFPVAIAEHQIDHGYAAYETKDNAGQITSLFIPAGGQTYLTWDNTLYAIWSA